MTNPIFSDVPVPSPLFGVKWCTKYTVSSLGWNGLLSAKIFCFSKLWVRLRRTKWQSPCLVCVTHSTLYIRKPDCGADYILWEVIGDPIWKMCFSFKEPLKTLYHFAHHSSKQVPGSRKQVPGSLVVLFYICFVLVVVFTWFSIGLKN